MNIKELKNVNTCSTIDDIFPDVTNPTMIIDKNLNIAIRNSGKLSLCFIEEMISKILPAAKNNEIKIIITEIGRYTTKTFELSNDDLDRYENKLREYASDWFKTPLYV